MSMDMSAPEMGGEIGYENPESAQKAPLPTNQKLIRKLRLNAETDDLDTIMQKVDEKIAALSGYAENREVYNSGSRRHASLVIRIPATQADQFVDHVSGASNVTSTNETADDITLGDDNDDTLLEFRIYIQEKYYKEMMDLDVLGELGLALEVKE
mgnify:CR=1 FL=1